ncbi:MAG: hypothetical protein DHS20C15_18500 [Planctomycetota bacterium]|nr:MAG: hypothetical protein DHS20C15_18500 [Planctomycetota bacterium]
MSPPDPHQDPQHEDFAGVAHLSGQEAITDELCLFVHSLRLDDRPVPAELAARVDAHVAASAELQRAVRGLSNDHELLSRGPEYEVPEGFAERVLKALKARVRTQPARRPGLVRFAAAAALLLGLSLVWDLSHPADVLADPDTATGRWIADDLRPDPFGPLQIEAALRKQLPGPLDAPLTASGTSMPAPGTSRSEASGGEVSEQR